MILRCPSACRYSGIWSAGSSPCSWTPVNPARSATSATWAGAWFTKTPILSMSSVRLEMISAAWSIPICRELGAKMNPKASAPAARLSCASGIFVVAQIFTQIIGLRPPAPAALAMPRRDDGKIFRHVVGDAERGERAARDEQLLPDFDDFD